MSKKMKTGSFESTEIESASGYWVYADGYSHWGISLHRNTEDGYSVGIPITKEDSDKLNTKEKAKFYKDAMVAIEAVKAAKKIEEDKRNKK